MCDVCNGKGFLVVTGLTEDNCQHTYPVNAHNG